MNNDTYDILTTLTPPDCLYFRAKVDGDGTITSIEGNSIDDEEDLISVASNLILNTVLIRCYGIDMASVVEDFVDSTVNRITDLSNVFKACDWENAVIKDNSTSPATDVPVLRYIRQKFSIKTSDAFIDTIYQKLANAVLGMQMDSKKSYVHCHLDGETNLMINVLAVVIAYNDDFMDINVGGEHYINIPLDPEHIDLFFEEIRKILVAGGYLASSISSLTLDGGIDWIFNPNTTDGFNVNGDFKYGHLFIAKCNDNDRWRPYIMATRFLVKEPITFNTQYETRGDYNYLFAPVFINQEDNLSYNRQYILVTPARVQYRVYMFPMGTTNQIFTSLDNCMGADDERNIYKNCTYENSALGDRTWLLVGTHSQSYTGPYNELNTPTLQVIVNNRADGGTAGLHQPTIDQTTEQNLEDNNIGLVCTGGESLDVYFTYANVNPALKPTDAPFDTRSTLKVGTVDPTLGVLLNDPNTNVTPFLKYNLASWSGLWLNDIELNYIKLPEPNLGMGLAYHLNEDMLSAVVDDLWDDSIWRSIVEWHLNDPYDTILFLKELPYDFVIGSDYVDRNQTCESEYEDYFFYDDSTVKIKYGNLSGGNAKGHCICSPVHEIMFVLKGDDKVQLHDNFTDYEPYVHTSIYLPFVGTRDIPPSLIMKEDLLVKYRISNITGDFVVFVVSLNKYATDGTTGGLTDISKDTYNMGAPILIETGNLALDRVVSGKQADVRGAITGLTNAISSAMGGYTKSAQLLSSGGNNSSTGHSSGRSHSESDYTHNRNPIMNGSSISDVFSENDASSQTAYTNRGHSTTSSHNTNISYGGIAQGVVQAGMSILAGSPVNHSNFAGNDGRWLGPRVPYITMIYNPPIADMRYDSAFNRTVGFASCQSIKIKDMEPDYHELMSIKLDGIKCTNEERQTIREILMSGFYNGSKKLIDHQPLRP